MIVRRNAIKIVYIFLEVWNTIFVTNQLSLLE